MRTTQNRGRLALFGGLMSFFILAANVPFAQTHAEAPHLEAARQAARDLQRDALVNEYGTTPTFLRWGHPTHEARTVCATFVTHLLEHTYDWDKNDIKKWLGANGADASDWYAVIVSENGFRRLTRINEARPGDFIAIKYNDDSKDTGHIMVIDQEPQRIAASSPVERGTDQYAVTVIDSSASGHGPNDTRHKPDGGFTGGIGRGTVRLYASREGRIVGYAWSETPKSKFYPCPKRDVVIGRLTRAKQETPAAK